VLRTNTSVPGTARSEGSITVPVNVLLELAWTKEAERHSSMQLWIGQNVGLVFHWGSLYTRKRASMQLDRVGFIFFSGTAWTGPPNDTDGGVPRASKVGSSCPCINEFGCDPGGKTVWRSNSRHSRTGIFPNWQRYSVHARSAGVFYYRLHPEPFEKNSEPFEKMFPLRQMRQSGV
jgi:hypothetical protein